MQGAVVSPSSSEVTPSAARLHYLDWLRVIAILGVFLFHAVHPFDMNGWHIKNPDQSLPLTIVTTWFSLWGMAFFYLISGAGSWFALRRRSSRQYAAERSRRLLIPFVAGAILFMPLMMYLEWRHNTALWGWTMSYGAFVLDHSPGFTPMWFGAVGYHLWFLGFLFCFSLLSLPIFQWLKSEGGRHVVAWLARLADHRGAMLLFFLPFLVIELVLRPLFPVEHDWGDFFYLMAYFIFGFLLFADARLATAVRRDGWLLMGAAVISLAAILFTYFKGDALVWSEDPSIPQYYLVWALVAANGYYWTTFMLFVGMRFLDFSNAYLRYGQEAVLPFFLLHQPVIIVVAYVVVQWSASIAVKLPIVVVGSFLISITVYELAIRNFEPMRKLFGMTVSSADEGRLRMA